MECHNSVCKMKWSNQCSLSAYYETGGCQKNKRKKTWPLLLRSSWCQWGRQTRMQKYNIVTCVHRKTKYCGHTKNGDQPEHPSLLLLDHFLKHVISPLVEEHTSTVCPCHQPHQVQNVPQCSWSQPTLPCPASSPMTSYTCVHAHIHIWFIATFKL